MIYFLIFLSKVIENALATLRLIVVANGKKLLGSLLQLAVAVVWVLVTGVVVTGISKDPLKVIFFGLGSFVGSYVGSLIEEKMALGSNMVMAITESSNGEKIAKKVRDSGYAVTEMEGNGKEKQRSILMIVVPRKQRPKLVRLIKKLDHNCMIIAENAFTIYGGYANKEG